MKIRLIGKLIPKLIKYLLKQLKITVMVTIIKSNKCIDSDYTAMKTLKRLSKKAAIFCEKSGHDINKVKKLMNFM